MAWNKADSDTLTSNANTISLTGFTPSKFNTYLCHIIPNGNPEPRFRLNNDTTTGSSTVGHATRSSRDGLSDTVGNERSDWVTSITQDTDDNFDIGYLANISGEEKLGITFAVVNNGNGADNVPRRREIYSKYTDGGTNAQITRFDNIDTDPAATKASGSNLTLLGSDGVGSMTVQDGAVYYETDTNKEYVLYDNTWTEL